jgi:hypothetical protein
MLYPATVREILGKLLLPHCMNIAMQIKKNGAGTGGSLIYRKYVLTHFL